MDHNPYVAPPDVRDVATISRIFRFLRYLIGSGVILFVAVALLLPSVSRSREAAVRTQCKNNLRQIGLALFNYLEEYGSFPPPYTVGKDGTPLHSWRTLLLPFIEHNELYKKIDLSKPWDDPVNLKAYASSVPPYRCPGRKDGSNLASFLAVVSDGSCFQPGRSIRIEDITDGPSNTLMIVEASAEVSVPWMSPQDLSENQILSVNSQTKLHHVGGFNALLADGSVRFISANTPHGTVHALISRDAHDTVGDF